MIPFPWRWLPAPPPVSAPPLPGACRAMAMPWCCIRASPPRRGARWPMRRAAQPDDIAQAVAWLVQSDYLTGEILLSDGGLNLT